MWYSKAHSPWSGFLETSRHCQGHNRVSLPHNELPTTISADRGPVQLSNQYDRAAVNVPLFLNHLQLLITYLHSIDAAIVTPYQ